MYRRLPNTDVDRTTAFDIPFDKFTDTPVPLRALTQAEFDAMVAVRTPWKAATDAEAVALNAQLSATNRADELAEELDKLISHFIQVFNLAVDRNYFPVAARAFYKLDANSDKTPIINSHADRLTWAQNIITGEAARAAAEGPGTPATLDSGLRLDEGIHMDSNVGGYKPMALPSADEVAAALALYKPAHKAASDAKDAYDRAQEAVKNLRPAADAQIRDQWDAIEYFFRKEEPASLRRKAREWGVVYVSRPGEPEDPENPTPPAPPA